ncbi:sensor histidine kinase [Streptomyces qinzhouensis]|uniref:histidine kinase n=1 Tax=Streptomyces qinzhouensis TaxID=2599401 RepID=A0A5B8JH69_9ACTN|nr:nitrate- and nitrite sensing domain-containing protein [Streptomyces qinzhouensis]QDY79201.1 HAMP domain-containing protein [Streptomyces qinzhouensis]
MQGRFKRDPQGRGEAAAGQEPRAGADHGSSPQPIPHAQHAQNPGQGPAAPGGDRAPGRPGARPGPPSGPGGSPAQGGRPTGPSGGPGGPQGPTGGGPSPTGSGPASGDGESDGSPAPVDTGSRLALRNWRISTRLVSLLTLPVVAATALGGLRINESMDRMKQLEHMQLLTDMSQEASKLAIALQYERDTTAGPLANNPNASDFKVIEPREATDRAAKTFLEAGVGVNIVDGDDTINAFRTTLGQIYAQLNKISEIRKTAYNNRNSSALTVEAYHQLINSLLDLSSEMAQATNNQDMIKRARALSAFAAAKEYASIQQAVIAAALPGGGGQKGTSLSEADRLYGQGAQNGMDNALDKFTNAYESLDGNALEVLAPMEHNRPDIATVASLADRAFKDSNGLKNARAQSHLDWTDAYSARIDAMKLIESSLLDDLETKARELREESKRDAIINGALIFFVLGVSLVGAFIVARSMIRSLRRLQDTATRVAQDRLPELVKQLSESDPEDVDTSVESVGVHSRDEIGKVAAAFDEVHREAVRLAAEQALLRGNVNAMFTNLSRRSQGLIQRQLSLISELESREADPDQLSSLFKLDHLATRMRRNGENLLVLAGEEPGRRWTRPVPLVDVLRAAASEVEQYERIELAAVPATEVAGRVVNDLVHLLAELLENATSFSSPQTKVRVTGHALPDGRVLVEIHDTGIGLSPEDLAAINERLASPPTVDVSVSRRMGLFVVGRLSLRHGIRIQLRPSESGGTTALVMLPVDVAQGGRKPQPAPGAPAGAQGRTPPPNGGAPLGAGPGNGPGAANGGRPGGQGAPAGGPLGAGAPRGQVGAGNGAGSRAALPSRDGGAPGGGRPQGGGGLAGAFGNRGAQRGGGNGPASGDTAALPRLGADGRPAPVRNELPDAGRGRPAGPSWGSDQRPGAYNGPNSGPSNGPNSGPNSGPNDGAGGRNAPGAPAGRGADTVRGHDDPGTPQGPAGTGGFPRQEFGSPPADRQDRAGLPPRAFEAPAAPQPAAPSAPQGQYVRDDVFGPPAQGPGPAQPPRTAPAADRFAPPQGAGDREPRFGEPAGPPPGGQFARPGTGAPQPPEPGRAPAPHGYEEQTAARHALPPQPRHEALPPARGDGGTPLYDTLETDWFRGQNAGGQNQDGPSHAGQNHTGQNQGGQNRTGRAETSDRPGAGEPFPGGAVQQTQPIPQIGRNGQGGPGPQGVQGGRPVPYDQGGQPGPAGHTGRFDQADRFGPAGAPVPVPRHDPAPQAPVPPTGGTEAGPGDAGWRSSPNDELVRQAERVRKPASGGVTTSGLPRRVPRANLVAGTAQQHGSQGGPSVSRAPDDVRGRLTNLRRGIQQGREQNGSSTGSFDLGPTHQQER